MSKETLKLALELALDALQNSQQHIDQYHPEWVTTRSHNRDAIHVCEQALEEALANHCEDNLQMVKQEQDEPVKYVRDENNVGYMYTQLAQLKAEQEQGKPDYWLGYGLQAHTEKPFEGATPVYTTSPQRKPLTFEKVYELWLARFETSEYDDVFMNFARAIEAAHGITSVTDFKE